MIGTAAGGTAPSFPPRGVEGSPFPSVLRALGGWGNQDSYSR